MQRVNAIIIREWKRIFSIPYFYMVLLVIPPIVFVFYGLIYKNEFVRNLPIAVWDEDHSSITRTLTDMLAASDNINIAYTASSEEEISDLMRRSDIFGAIHFPKDLEADAKKNKPATITLFTNSSLIVPSNMVYKDAAPIIIQGSLAAVLQRAEKGGLPASQAKALVQPIKLNISNLYNPELNYKEYLVPGLVTVGLQMALLVAGVLALNMEENRKTLGELLSISSSSSEIIVGKTLAHITVSWINFGLIFYVIFPLFGLAHPGNLSIFIAYNLLVLASLGLSFAVSAIVKNLLTAVEVALFYAAPAFVFSGYTFPRSAMPWYDQYYALAMPYSHFLDAFIKLYYMHLPVDYVTKHLVSLLIFGGVGFPIAIVVYQMRINKTLRNAAHS